MGSLIVGLTVRENIAPNIGKKVYLFEICRLNPKKFCRR